MRHSKADDEEQMEEAASGDERNASGSTDAAPAGIKIVNMYKVYLNII